MKKFGFGGKFGRCSLMLEWNVIKSYGLRISL